MALFSRCCRFFLISGNISGLFLLKVETNVKGSFVFFILGFLSSESGIFSTFLMPSLIIGVGYFLSDRLWCNSSRRVLFKIGSLTIVQILRARVYGTDLMQFFG